jgi:Caspase domain
MSHARCGPRFGRISTAVLCLALDACTSSARLERPRSASACSSAGERERERDRGLSDRTVSAAAVPAVQRRALLVGINDYEFDDIPDLRGTQNDVNSMVNVLQERFGFGDDEILVLRDKAATKAGIISAFRRQLIDSATPDTAVLFYFSGHGSRLRDASGDEPDGYDETLVTYDSGRRAGHENRDLSDDEVNVLLRELGAKTPHVTVVLDSCHSGTAVRGSGVAKWVEPDERVPSVARSAPAGAAVADDGRSGFRPEDLSYVLISGAASGEVAHEKVKDGYPGGVLTQFLTEALSKAAPDATYRDIMDRVATRVSVEYPAQHPQIEGLERDTLLFGTARREPEPFFEVGLRSERVVLQAGAIQGVTRGSRFEVFAPATKAPVGAPLASLEITDVGGTTSEVSVLSGATKLEPGARAFETNHQFDAIALRVQLWQRTLHPELDEVASALRSLPQVALVTSDYDMAVSIGKGGEFLIERATADSHVGRVPAGPAAPAEVVRQLAGWAKWYSLQRLDNDRSPGIPVSLGTNASEAENVAGREIQVFLQNCWRSRLYLSVFDLSSDGSVSLLYPQPGSQEFIEPGDSWTKPLVPCVPADLSETRDVIKVFVSEEPHDLSFVEQTALQQGVQKSLAERPSSGDRGLEDLVSSVALGVLPRGAARPTEVVPDGWATRQLTIQVKATEPSQRCGD